MWRLLFCQVIKDGREHLVPFTQVNGHNKILMPCVELRHHKIWSVVVTGDSRRRGALQLMEKQKTLCVSLNWHSMKPDHLRWMYTAINLVRCVKRRQQKPSGTLKQLTRGKSWCLVENETSEDLDSFVKFRQQKFWWVAVNVTVENMVPEAKANGKKQKSRFSLLWKPPYDRRFSNSGQLSHGRLWEISIQLQSLTFTWTPAFESLQNVTSMMGLSVGGW